MQYGRAVVIGGGMGGLVTARVLADHFTSVVLLDRDTLPDEPGDRGGIPQGHHVHTILPGGFEILDGLLPGLAQELRDGGSHVPEPHEFYFLTPEGRSYSQLLHMPEPPPRRPGVGGGYFQTRAWLEHCVRRRVAALPNVEIRDRTMVRELIAEGTCVRGVRTAEDGKALEADLVLDATGRVSRTLGWLDTLGFERPRESRIHCDFAYASMRVRPADPTRFPDVGCLIRGDSAHPRRGGALFRVEDDSILATLGGRLGDYPPTEVDDFVEFAATLADPLFHDVVKGAEIVAPLQRFRFPDEIRRHYRELDAFPEGLLPIGDAVCHFNPNYGQGMSSAARQAVALGDVLRARREAGEPLSGTWRAYFEAAHEQTRAPWLLAALSDFEHEGTTGDFPVEEQPAMAALGQLRERALAGDLEAGATLVDVTQMRQPLSVLDSLLSN
ncbi:MAG: hypothetical protein PVH91_14150 [Pseudomonadales bacterium]|jgi:2-polyprenyl-6-methoxyphenol hydroxylase-like FAD-dependent oxidoreductase